MKNTIYNILAGLAILLTGFSCTELDLVQEDAASSATWYQNKDQFRQSLNEGYREVFWPTDESAAGLTDDWQRRDALDDIKAGTVSSEYGAAQDSWENIYKAITRILVVIDQLENQDVLSAEDTALFMAEANFLRASYWSYLISHYGDVPFYEKELTVDESFEMGRTNKNEILQKIYGYYDDAALNLPVSYNGLKYATKGAAYAMKARIALYMGDFAVAAEASEDCIDLGEYELHADFSELFRSSTKNSNETIFHIPRSSDLNVIRNDNVRDYLPRNHGGWGARNPTWELLASFECTDGLPVDESPLFDPQNPFKNRDPRCNMTIVPFGSLEDGDGLSSADGSNFIAIEYTPHPEKKEVLDFASGDLRRNDDTPSVAAFASFNGLAWKKGIDEDWKDYRTDPDLIVIRYADVLLMYAESKIELNQIDQSVLDAMNQVRDRAYANSGIPNPEIVTTDQAELRYKVRNERRAELAFEGRRYMDLIRWRLAEKALTGNSYGLLNVATDANVGVAPTGPLMDNVVTPGLWFWGMTPEIDADGLPDFSALLNAGLCRSLNTINFPTRQYLWPIPASERLLNANLTQNEGY
ncbi:RagB/SusD family nutrient uptake outer membrane protein [Kriegella aquimaris]|uniref:Starch-binding associating with outer membrane n=1 Tax=Kriegella aquimaris TaxID=192904 RepID=A0A1G9NRG7_9FLAO|nr:RagB/SusD family nutrient uptake outer membrane protein [Kriegella aquimaris]SDL89188.1 Starch-binding associating with outer membrane [Kriegella aquimaris]